MGLPLALRPACGSSCTLSQYTARVGEEQQVGVRAGDEEVLDEVLFLEVHADHALAAAPLRAVGGHRQPLDVAGRARW